MPRCLLCALLLAMAVGAHTAPEVPALTGRLVDQAGLLGSGEATQVTNALQQFERHTGAQMAVLIIPELGRETIESYSIRVADTWSLGDRERDDGLLLVIATAERKTRLEVGQGLEGAITDGRAGDLLRDLTPHFRAGNHGDGILAVVNGAARWIAGTPLPGVKVAPVQHRNPWEGVITTLLLLIFAAVVLYSNWRRRRPGSLWVVGGGFGHGGSYRSGGFGGGGGFSGSGGGFSGSGGGFSGGGASGGW